MAKANNSVKCDYLESVSNGFEVAAVTMTFFAIHSLDQDHLACFYFTHVIEFSFRQFSDFDFVVYTDHADSFGFTLVSDHVERVTRISISLLCYRFNWFFYFR